tara:strand:+ start:46 stop:438 length:393 start_codon:yes stop_codon:yes gene_type:complete
LLESQFKRSKISKLNNPLTRVFILGIILLFASIDNNPLVKLQAILGLSPSPIEKLFEIKSLFSGMTEGVHQLLNFDISKAINANIFSPFVVPIMFFFTIRGKVPKIDSKAKELIFFSCFIFLSLLVNIFN